MYKIVIVVQNLKIGGFQRVALDEAYAFKSLGLDVCILTLEPFMQNEFYILEGDLIKSYGLEITFVGQTRLEFLKTLINFVQPSMEYKFICHNLRGTVLIKLLKAFSPRKHNNILIITVIHQLPALSSYIQRHKRFLYASFSDLLFAYSKGVKLDWDLRVRDNVIYQRLFRNKKINILRNGVFLERLPNIADNVNLESGDLRLLFLGRNTGWKGIQTVIKIGEDPSLKNAYLHFIVPSNDKSFLRLCSEGLLRRISFQIGGSISSFKPNFGDVHLYPTNYGDGVKFIESISLNCLEMAAIGVPSLISSGGLGTWPEFRGLSLIREVNWHEMEETIELIKQVSNTTIDPVELNYIRKIVNIENHVNILISFFD